MNDVTAKHKVLIGPAGWSYKDWDGIVYPARLKKTQHPVEYLAQFFDCIEINTSFYGHIKPEWGKLWCSKAAAVNPDFEFTAKLNKAFTHSPTAVVQPTSAATLMPNSEDEGLAKEGLDSIAREGKLGGVLAQFPISFKNTNENRDYLETLLARFREYPMVVEVRHSSWNNQAILQYFAAKGVAFCNIDQPLLGKSLRATEYATSPLGYVRLHGRNYEQWFDSDSRNDRYNYLYQKPDLEKWKVRIDAVAEKTEKMFVVTNNHFEGKAVVNALQLKSMITHRPVAAPEILLQKYPELRQICE